MGKRNNPGFHVAAPTAYLVFSGTSVSYNEHRGSRVYNDNDNDNDNEQWQ